MHDITVIFLTQNKVPEKWAQYHREVLEKAIRGAPIVSVSRKPMDFGTNIIQAEPESAVNIFWQTLRAAKLATTPYIAIAEDDTLYPEEHFYSFRPPPDTFAYNHNRWGMLTWSPLHIYYLAHKFTSHMTMIAPRELTIEALEERFKKYPLVNGSGENAGGELGKNWREQQLGVTPRKSTIFYSEHPVLFYQHPDALDPLNKTCKKRMTKIRAFDLPYWGHADEMIKKFQ